MHRMVVTAALAVVFVLAVNTLWATPALADLTQVLAPAGTAATQLQQAVQNIVRAVAVLWFLGFFVWALISGRWDFIKLGGMAVGVIGFAASGSIVDGLMSIGSGS